MKSCKYYFDTEAKQNYDHVHAIYDVLRMLIKAKIVSSIPQLFKLLTLFLTVPVTVATRERSVSKLNIIKSYLGSCMSEEKLERWTCHVTYRKECNYS